MNFLRWTYVNVAGYATPAGRLNDPTRDNDTGVFSRAAKIDALRDLVKTGTQRAVGPACLVSRLVNLVLLDTRADHSGRLSSADQ